MQDTKQGYSFDIREAKRIVVKVGSSSLTLGDGSLNQPQLSLLACVIAQAHQRGAHVVLVSSGAQAAGTSPLGLHSRPKDLATYQAACMVGQVRLMAAYAKEFEKYGITVGQVLLTVEDIIDRNLYTNARASLSHLLDLGIVPILNENDAVAAQSRRFGDNDRLAALTSHLVGADALVLLTDVDGLYTAPPREEGAKLIRHVGIETDLTSFVITAKGSSVGTGGMASKVQSATIARQGGVPVILTCAQNIAEVFEGKQVGTFFEPTGKSENARSLWIRFAARARGRIIVDDGAAGALQTGAASLLLVGVRAVGGFFDSGDLVEVEDNHGHPLGRGLVAYSSAELMGMIGRGENQGRKPVIHVNDLALY